MGTGFYSPDAVEGDFLALVSRFDSLIQRLQHSRVHRGDDVHRRIEFFFRHPRFPCVRKAPIDSRIAKAHHRDGKTDEHLFPLGEILDGVGVTVKCSKICFLQGPTSSVGLALNSADKGPSLKVRFA